MIDLRLVALIFNLISLIVLVVAFFALLKAKRELDESDTVTIYKTRSVGKTEASAFLVNDEAKRMFECVTQKINTPYVPEIRKKVLDD